MQEMIAEFYQQAQEKIHAFDQFVLKNNLVDSAVADHIGYKCSSSEEFIRLRTLIESEVVFLYQSIIAGRRIVVAQLARPLATVAGIIMFLELADQKPDNSQVSGFDHVEFFPKYVSVEELAEELAKKGVVVSKTTRPHHTTYDMQIDEGFKVRIESESLMEKIVREEIKK